MTAHCFRLTCGADLSVIGGHLAPGCAINTTTEVVLLALSGTTFSRTYDESTGCRELTIDRHT